MEEPVMERMSDSSLVWKKKFPKFNGDDDLFQIWFNLLFRYFYRAVKKKLPLTMVECTEIVYPNFGSLSMSSTPSEAEQNCLISDMT